MTKQQHEKMQEYLSKELDPAFARRAKILAKHLDIKGREKILEVGCGRGFYEGFLSYTYPDIHITGLDLRKEYLSVARSSVSSKNVTLIEGDAMKLPFKNNTFDRIFASEVLEHLPDHEKALKEMLRVLKKGGTGIFTVPNKNYPVLWDPLNKICENAFGFHMPKDIWWLAGIWADHVRLYSEKELVDVVTRSGFSVENVWRSTHASIPFEHFLLYGIGKNLVEHGLFPNMYRFNPKAHPSYLFSFVKKITYFFDHINKDSELEGVSTVNCIVKVSK